MKEQKRKSRVGSGLSEEFFAKVGCTSRLCAVAVFVCYGGGRSYSECKKRLDEEILYADDLVLMKENMDELRENFDQ